MKKVVTCRGAWVAKEGWLVYVLRCRDATLYTGTTNDLPRRLAAHTAGRGARYTRGRGPFMLVHLEAAPSRSAALRREQAIKRLSRPAKEALLAQAGHRVPDAGILAPDQMGADGRG